MDYKTFGQEEEEADKATMIVGRDRGTGDEWVVDRDGDQAMPQVELKMVMEDEGDLAKMLDAQEQKRTAENKVGSFPAATEIQNMDTDELLSLFDKIIELL